MIYWRQRLHSPSKGPVVPNTVQRMDDRRFCSWVLRMDKYPVPDTLLSLHMYPPLTIRPSPAAISTCAAACQVHFGAKRPEKEKRAPQPTCSGNGNDGATSTKPTGNLIEGISAHMFRKALRSKPDQLLWCQVWPETEMMAPLSSTKPKTE